MLNRIKPCQNIGMLFALVVSRNFGTLADTVPRPFGTKTGYELSLTNTEQMLVDNPGYKLVPSFCSAIHINGIFRHGTRDPDLSALEDFEELYNTIHGNVNNPSFSDLNSLWKPLYPPSRGNHKLLADVGKREHEAFGRSFATRYRNLLGSSDTEEVLFFSSHKSRSQNSCSSFQGGFNDILGKDGPNEIEIRDDLMRFFDTCQKYLDEVDDNDDAASEVKKFLNGEEMANVARQLTDTLQLPVNMSLTPGEATAAYIALAYDEAFKRNEGKSYWRDAFVQEQLEICEYLTDLKQYWKKGYGYPINYEQSCPLLADALTRLEAAADAQASNASYVKGVFQFGHAETTMPIMTLLGLYKDEAPFTAANYQANKNRKFKTGLISPFATNLAFVLYKCNTDAVVTDQDKNSALPGLAWPVVYDQYMVQLLVKEVPVKFPFSDFHLTPLSGVLHHYASEGRCDFDELCSNN